MSSIFVWNDWHSESVGASLIWLVIAVLGVFAGQRGAALKGSLTAGLKRYGYLISCIVFLFLFADTNMLAEGADGSAGLLAGLAVIFWLAWMFFSGATRWGSSRIIIGLLLLTFLWMQTWTMVDRWSTLYFVIWLTAGALAFKRGENAQAEPHKEADMEGGGLFQRYSVQAMLAAVAWLAALLILPSLIAGLDAQGILQTSPQELLPLSDKRIWGGLMLTMQLTILGVGRLLPHRPGAGAGAAQQSARRQVRLHPLHRGCARCSADYRTLPGGADGAAGGPNPGLHRKRCARLGGHHHV